MTQVLPDLPITISSQLDSYNSRVQLALYQWIQQSLNEGTGSFPGFAATAGQLTPGAAINGVNFDGTADITIPAPGSVLAADLANTTDPTKGVALVGGASRVVASIAALRTLPKTGSPQAFTLGYYVPGDGGGNGPYRYDSTDTTSADNGVTIIVASDGGRWKITQTGALFVKQAGCKCDGTTDDTTAFVAARAAAIGGTLHITGTPLLTAQQIVSAKEHWVFEGANGNTITNYPSSYLFKGPAVSGPLVQLAAQSCLIEGGGLVGQSGNTGDGIQIFSNSITLRNFFVSGMQRDGIRIGDDTTYSNCDSFVLDCVVSVNNTRHGINLNGATSAVDVNAGCMIKPFCQNNGGSGLYINEAEFGTTIIAPLLESNTDRGIYLDTKSLNHVIIGGDIEANTGGNVLEVVPFNNRFIDTMVQGCIYNNRLQTSTFTPVITGATTAGTGTYTIQNGSYTITGNRFNYDIELNWTAHTGTGQLYVSLPAIAVPMLTNAGTSGTLPVFVPAAVASSGITMTSGGQPVILLDTGNSQLQFYQSLAGSLGALAVPASGTLYISGSFVMQQYSFTL